jgi:DNA-3-methyladenine glycosylase II
MSKQAIKHFKKYDPILHEFAYKFGELEMRKNKRSHFEALVEAIVSQQLSVKASDTIFKRFVDLFPGKKFPKPEDILKISRAKIRSTGVSEAKTNYILDLSEKVFKKELKLQNLDKFDNEQVIEELTKVKGIGRWTAEMFLMFSLLREDIFSTGDQGLKNAIRNLYKLKSHPTEKQLNNLFKKWSPYKTYAARYLWKSLDNEPK